MDKAASMSSTVRTPGGARSRRGKGMSPSSQGSGTGEGALSGDLTRVHMVICSKVGKEPLKIMLSQPFA